jgi:hypothetical protein
MRFNNEPPRLRPGFSIPIGAERKARTKKRPSRNDDAADFKERGVPKLISSLNHANFCHRSFQSEASSNVCAPKGLIHGMQVDRFVRIDLET